MVASRTTGAQALGWSALASGLAGTVVAALISFGVFDWTSKQGGLVTAEATAVISLIAAFLKHRQKGTRREPVMLVSALFALVGTSISLYAGFAFDPADVTAQQQVAAVLGLVSSVGTLVAALVARHFVSPTAPDPS